MVAAWIWVLVYIVAFCLFQVLLYRYLQQDDTAFEQATPDYGEGEGRQRQTPARPAGTENLDGVQCPHCGTYNDSSPIFTYCRACIEPINGTR